MDGNCTTNKCTSTNSQSNNNGNNSDRNRNSNIHVNTLLNNDCTRTSSSIPRLIHRNLPTYQSKNRFHIQNRMTNPTTQRTIYQLIRHDWYHVLLRGPLYSIILGLLVVWTISILLFAGLYYGADHINPNTNCTLGYNGTWMTFRSSFAFSLQTSTTVGYTLPNGSNAFFEHCPDLQILIFCQMIYSLLFNAFFLAFIFARVAKCDSRGIQVIFGHKALISIHTIIHHHPNHHNHQQHHDVVDSSNGQQQQRQSTSSLQQQTQPQLEQVRFQIRMYDISSGHAPVVEAHVRVYAIVKDDPIPKLLRLHQPDDELGGMLLLSIPSVVCHHIDLYSALHPPLTPAVAVSTSSTSTSSTSTSSTSSSSPTPLSRMNRRHGLTLRQSDSRTGSRDEIICPICGEAYGTVERWKAHVKYNQIIEQYDHWPITQMSHLSLTDTILDEMTNVNQSTSDIVSIEQYFQQHVSEVIVIVEGIEPTISGSFAAMQSYRYEDIVFERNAYFRPCIRKMIPQHNYNNNNTDVPTPAPQISTIESSNNNHHNQVTYQDDKAPSSSSSSSSAPDTPSTLQIDLDCFHSIDYDIIPMMTTASIQAGTGTTAGGPLTTTGIPQQHHHHLKSAPRLKKPREQQQSLRYHDSFFASNPRIVVPSQSGITNRNPSPFIIQENCNDNINQ